MPSAIPPSRPSDSVTTARTSAAASGVTPGCSTTTERMARAGDAGLGRGGIGRGAEPGTPQALGDEHDVGLAPGLLVGEQPAGERHCAEAERGDHDGEHTAAATKASPQLAQHGYGSGLTMMFLTSTLLFGSWPWIAKVPLEIRRAAMSAGRSALSGSV